MTDTVPGVTYDVTVSGNAVDPNAPAAGRRRLYAEGNTSAAGVPPDAAAKDDEAVDFNGSLYVVTAIGLQKNGSDGSNGAGVVSLGDMGTGVKKLMQDLQGSVVGTSQSAGQSLWNVLFWVTLIFLVVAAAHAITRGVLIWRRKTVPNFLAWPSLELTVLMVAIPIMAAAATKALLWGTPGQQVAGLVFAVLIPVIFIASVAALVLYKIYWAPPFDRAALFVLDHRRPLDTPPHWFVRYFLRPVFGYDPRLTGHWVPGPGQAAQGGAFLARFGGVFDVGRGPPVHVAPGSYEYDPLLGRMERVRIAHAPHPSRWHAAAVVVVVLAVAIATLKAVLFVDLMTGLAGQTPGRAALWSAIFLLGLTLAYWAYLRSFVPIRSPLDLVAEVVMTANDVGTFSSGIALAVADPADVQRIVSIGTAMIVFQTINLFLPYIMIIVFKLLPLLWRLGCRATARALRRVRPTARFVAAVRSVMRQDSHIMARKFADRWLLLVHRRGLGQRELQAHERPQTVLPFPVRRLLSVQSRRRRRPPPLADQLADPETVPAP